MEKIAEAASKQTAAMSALTGGFTGGLISKLPGGLLLKRSIEIWAFTADIAMKMAAAQRSGERERKLEVSEDLCEGRAQFSRTDAADHRDQMYYYYRGTWCMRRARGGAPPRRRARRPRRRGAAISL